MTVSKDLRLDHQRRALLKMVSDVGDDAVDEHWWTASEPAELRDLRAPAVAIQRLPSAGRAA